MTDQEWKNIQVADRVTSILFVNGSKEEAHRLVLTSTDGRNLGGWCKRAVIDQIITVLAMDFGSAPEKPR